MNHTSNWQETNGLYSAACIKGPELDQAVPAETVVEIPQRLTTVLDRIHAFTARARCVKERLVGVEAEAGRECGDKDPVGSVPSAYCQIENLHAALGYLEHQIAVIERAVG